MDQVIKIDKANPQVAVRVIQPLTRWQQLDERRAELMKVELQRIAQIKELSKDIYEIVSKSVGNK